MGAGPCSATSSKVFLSAASELRLLTRTCAIWRRAMTPESPRRSREVGRLAARCAARLRGWRNDDVAGRRDNARDLTASGVVEGARCVHRRRRRDLLQLARCKVRKNGSELLDRDVVAGSVTVGYVAGGCSVVFGQAGSSDHVGSLVAIVVVARAFQPLGRRLGRAGGPGGRRPPGRPGRGAGSIQPQSRRACVEHSGASPARRGHGGGNRTDGVSGGVAGTDRASQARARSTASVRVCTPSLA